MNLVNRDTDYVIRSLVFMAKRQRVHKNSLTTVDMIVKKERVPRVFLRKISELLIYRINKKS